MVGIRNFEGKDLEIGTVGYRISEFSNMACLRLGLQKIVCRSEFGPDWERQN